MGVILYAHVKDINLNERKGDIERVREREREREKVKREREIKRGCKSICGTRININLNQIYILYCNTAFNAVLTDLFLVRFLNVV